MIGGASVFTRARERAITAAKRRVANEMVSKRRLQNICSRSRSSSVVSYRVSSSLPQIPASSVPRWERLSSERSVRFSRTSLMPLSCLGAAPAYGSHAAIIRHVITAIKFRIAHCFASVSLSLCVCVSLDCLCLVGWSLAVMQNAKGRGVEGSECISEQWWLPNIQSLLWFFSPRSHSRGMRSARLEVL